MKLRELTIKEQPAPAPNPAGQGAPNPAPEQPAVKAAGAVQKVGQGAKMAAAKMGAKGGTGGMMAKGLDKLARWCINRTKTDCPLFNIFNYLS